MTNDSDRRIYLRREGKYELAGRVEAVELETNLDHSYCAFGRVKDGDDVCVTNGRLSHNRRCLVRFDDKERTTMGNFLTSVVYDDFSGLNLEDYILCGHWEEWMTKNRTFPDFEEINRYFDPGHFCWVIYGGKQSERVAIYKGHIESIRLIDHLQIINHNLPDPRKAARFMLAESRDALDEIMDEIVKAGYLPIELDNLEENRNQILQTGKRILLQ